MPKQVGTLAELNVKAGYIVFDSEAKVQLEIHGTKYEKAYGRATYEDGRIESSFWFLNDKGNWQIIPRKKFGSIKDIGAESGDTVVCLLWPGTSYKKGEKYPVVEGAGVIGKSVGTESTRYSGVWRVFSETEERSMNMKVLFSQVDTDYHLWTRVEVYNGGYEKPAYDVDHSVLCWGGFENAVGYKGKSLSELDVGVNHRVWNLIEDRVYKVVGQEQNFYHLVDEISKKDVLERRHTRSIFLLIEDFKSLNKLELIAGRTWLEHRVTGKLYEVVAYNNSCVCLRREDGMYFVNEDFNAADWRSVPQEKVKANTKALSEAVDRDFDLWKQIELLWMRRAETVTLYAHKGKTRGHWSAQEQRYPGTSTHKIEFVLGDDGEPKSCEVTKL